LSFSVTAENYPDIDLWKIAGLSDKLIHRYFGAKQEIVWIADQEGDSCHQTSGRGNAQRIRASLISFVPLFAHPVQPG
jgi:hypothetical protein